MSRGITAVALALVAWAAAIVVVSVATPPEDGQHGSPPLAFSSPEARAVAFLVAEVPRWRREHPCYSCHNNGDAARALMAAARSGIDVADALEDNLEWLRHPRRWADNAGRGDASDDKILARIQFAGALASAVESRLASLDALVEAAGYLAADQHLDGSWRLDASESIGSPATYGLALATASARRTLADAGDPRLQPAVARADRWLRALDVKTVLDAAAIILGLESAADADAVRQRQRSLAVIEQGQGPGGGWGPYVTSAPEPFDTAVALLALCELREHAGLASPAFTDVELNDAIARGRRFLIDRQVDDGSWLETTRPSGQESYAQRISTTGWAALALLASNDRR